jgi:hypothetical protein
MYEPMLLHQFGLNWDLEFNATFRKAEQFRTQENAKRL